jgi:integrase
MPTLKRHDLRRTFITRCRRAEIPMEITMALSDHKDVRTMLSVYRRVDECDTRQALARLEAQGGSYA